MKVIHLFLEDEEYNKLREIKKRLNLKSWHDFFVIMLEYEESK